MDSTDFWLGKISRLKVDRASGDPAPHKPLLLLVILDLAEKEKLPKEILPLSPELAFKFCTLWSIVAHRRTQKPDVRLPFHHLSTDGFWNSLDENGKASAHRHQTRFARFADGFTHFVRDVSSRDKARRLILAKYFPPSERAALCATLGLPIPSELEVERDAFFKSAEEAETVGREIRFRLNIVAAYNYTCALTGYRLTTISAGSIVDAAHIHSFAKSRNNDFSNGIALCKNAHWLFDQGLWTISDDYRAIVAVGKFSESSPDGRALKEYHAHLLRLPSEKVYWPSPVHLAWHRKNVFQGV